MNRSQIIKNGKKETVPVTAGCPCERCDAKWVWRGEDGEIVFYDNDN